MLLHVERAELDVDLNMDLHFHSEMPTKVMVSNRTSFSLPGQKIKLKETREARVKLR